MTLDLPSGSGAWDIDPSYLRNVADSVPWPHVTADMVQDVLLACKAKSDKGAKEK